MGVLCGGSEPPPSGEGGSGRPGPLPLAREAFSLGLVGLDGRHSCRRPSYCQQFCPHSLVGPASPHSDGEPAHVWAWGCVHGWCVCAESGGWQLCR